MAKAALEAGFHVFCDKPMTTRLDHAEELVRLVESTGRIFALTHNYTGYPLVRQAREMIASGELGEIRAVRVNYIQGWMRGAQPGVTPPRGAWKDDPERNGPAATMGDVGTHAYNLARYMSGLQPVEVSARLMTYAPGRQLDDYGHALIRCENDALIMVTASQVTHGRLNDLSIEIDGEDAALSWRQEEPNVLIVRQFGEPQRIYDRHPAAGYMNESGRNACRLPAGHPEAFFEAFANVYSVAFDDIVAANIAGRDSVFNAIEQAVLEAAQKVLGTGRVISVTIDRDTGDQHVFCNGEELTSDETGEILGSVQAAYVKRSMIESIRMAHTRNPAPLYPTVYDGLEGVRFLEQTVASSRANGQWLPLLTRRSES